MHSYAAPWHEPDSNELRVDYSVVNATRALAAAGWDIAKANTTCDPSFSVFASAQSIVTRACDRMVKNEINKSKE